MKQLIIFFILFFSINVFATQSFAPYRVIGTACADHEHCIKYPKDKLLGGGYFIKSNIPLDDNRQGTLRPNMITKDILRKETAGLKEALRECKTNTYTSEPHGHRRPASSGRPKVGKVNSYSRDQNGCEKICSISRRGSEYCAITCPDNVSTTSHHADGGGNVSSSNNQRVATTTLPLPDSGSTTGGVQ